MVTRKKKSAATKPSLAEQMLTDYKKLLSKHVGDNNIDPYGIEDASTRGGFRVKNPEIDATFSIDGFEHCCGAQEFGAFEYSGPKDLELPTWRYMFAQLVKVKTGMLIATHYRTNPVAVALRQLGWTETPFVNPNTRHKLSVFTKVIHG